MITNIVAAVVVTLVTNVVQTDNATFERDPFISFPEGGGPMRIDKEATERYTTTTVTEHTSITVPLPDGPSVFTKDRLLSSVSAVWKRLEEWKPSGTRTNPVSAPEIPSVWFTNRINVWARRLLIRRDSFRQAPHDRHRPPVRRSVRKPGALLVARLISADFYLKCESASRNAATDIRLAATGSRFAIHSRADNRPHALAA